MQYLLLNNIPYRTSSLDHVLSHFFDDQIFGISHRFSLRENEENGNYQISVELPGYKQEDIEIEVKDEVLTVKAKNQNRSFNQSVTLPYDTDIENITAKLEYGVLTIEAPRSEKSKPRTIKIKN